MNLITILESNRIENNRKNSFIYLSVQKYLVEQYFDWLEIKILFKESVLVGKGKLKIGNKYEQIEVYFSPFFNFREDRIFVKNRKITYNDDVHLYKDLSLCLYHPIIDQPIYGAIPLYKMIPWISEWCIHYQEWKKYGVWLGKEIKH